MTRRTSELITLVLLPLSILMVCYALFVYHFCSKFLKKKQVRAPEESCSTDSCIEPYLQHRSASCRTCPATAAMAGRPCVFDASVSVRSAMLALRFVRQHTGVLRVHCKARLLFKRVDGSRTSSWPPQQVSRSGTHPLT